MAIKFLSEKVLFTGVNFSETNGKDFEVSFKDFESKIARAMVAISGFHLEFAHQDDEPISRIEVTIKLKDIIDNIVKGRIYVRLQDKEQEGKPEHFPDPNKTWVRVTAVAVLD